MSEQKRRYRITTLASVEFFSDTLGAGFPDTPEWALGQFRDTVRAHNKVTDDFKVSPDFQGARIEIANEEGEPLCEDTGGEAWCCECLKHKALRGEA